MEAFTIPAGNACGFLTTMLERVQAQSDHG
jgi:hypothetical protein